MEMQQSLRLFQCVRTLIGSSVGARLSAALSRQVELVSLTCLFHSHDIEAIGLKSIDTWMQSRKVAPLAISLSRSPHWPPLA
jgi:hypothetical protein